MFFNYCYTIPKQQKMFSIRVNKKKEERKTIICVQPKILTENLHITRDIVKPKKGTQ